MDKKELVSELQNEVKNCDNEIAKWTRQRDEAIKELEKWHYQRDAAATVWMRLDVELSRAKNSKESV